MQDSELVQAVRERREEAVAEFLERFRALFAHCIAQFESDASAREDLFQELTWYVFERLDRNSYDAEKGSLGTWLYRVAWCRCVDLKRKQNARKSLRVHLGGEELEEQVDAAPGPAHDLGEREIARLVRRSLEELPDQDRALLALRYLDGLTLGEIGRRHSISLEQTKYRLRRALTQMRAALLARMPSREAVE